MNHIRMKLQRRKLLGFIQKIKLDRNKKKLKIKSLGFSKLSYFRLNIDEVILLQDNNDRNLELNLNILDI